MLFKEILTGISRIIDEKRRIYGTVPCCLCEEDTTERGSMLETSADGLTRDIIGLRRK